MDMDINENYHLFKDIHIYFVFQISNLLSFIKKETSKKVSFFVSNVSCSFLVLVHIKKMQELIPSHREYCSNHFHK